MLSVLFRRSTFAAQKVWHWAGPPQRCWTSVLAGTPRGGSSSLQTCWASAARLPFSEKDNGQVKPPALLHIRRNKKTHASQFLVRIQHFHCSAVRLKKRQKVEAPELDLLRFDMKHLFKGPKPALYLGFAGLIPFVAPTLLMGMAEVYFPELAYAQLAYGASIVSFLGGARWGFALPESSPAKPDWLNLGCSVVPSLLAWISMLLSDSIISAAMTVIMSLGVALHYDVSLLPAYPNWFKALRTVLTLVASFCLFGTILINEIYPEKKIFSD